MALSVVLIAQMVRMFIALVFDYGERVGTTTGAIRAGGLALLISLAPLLLPVVGRLAGRGRSLPLVLVALAVVRAAVQFVHPIPLWLGAVGAVMSLIALGALILAARPRFGGDGRAFVIAFVVGLAADTALRTAFRTWDVAWQAGAGPVIFGLLPVAAVIGLVVLVAPGLTVDEHAGTLRIVAFGSFLFLQMLYAQNVPFVASSGHVSLALAAALVLLGDLLAVGVMVAFGDLARGPWALLGGVALIVLATFLMRVYGSVVLALVLGVSLLAAPLAALCVHPSPGPVRRGWWRFSTAVAGAGFLFVLLVLLYQVVYRVKIPVPNTVLPSVAALVLALPALRGKPVIERSGRTLGAWIAVPAVLLLVPLVMAASGAPSAVAGNGRSIRLVSFNVHMSFDQSGQLDPGHRPHDRVASSRYRGAPGSPARVAGRGRDRSRRVAIAPARHGVRVLTGS